MHVELEREEREQPSIRGAAGRNLIAAEWTRHDALEEAREKLFRERVGSELGRDERGRLGLEDCVLL
ncbi:MAG: hypothetical protein FJ299_15790 [Planctomycetes bacterium]|nr:hypothetical protein [Planctomycetota bacterium]